MVVQDFVSHLLSDIDESILGTWAFESESCESVIELIKYNSTVVSWNISY